MDDNKRGSIDNIPESTPAYAILHFDLEDEEGERRLRECLDAPNVLRAVEDFEREIHEILKYSKGPEVWGKINGYAALDRVRDMLFECFAANNVIVPGWE